MIYFISDLHIGDKNLIKNFRTRFSSVAEHNEYIVKRWNETVQKDDIVYVLGDIGSDKTLVKETFSKLRGKKIFVAGNHDKFSKKYYSEIFDETYYTPIYYSKRILLSHYPRMVEQGVINVHGHIHEILLDSKQHINVSCEVIDYTPIRITKIENILPSLEKENLKFLHEWYKDIMKPIVERDDVILNEDGTINVQLSLIYKQMLKSFPKLRAKEVKSNFNEIQKLLYSKKEGVN